MSLSVLVVDDSATMRRMIIKTLMLCGAPIGNVHEASNGREGLELLEDQWIDLLLVDINMPVMNGLEMIERVRESDVNRDLAIIVVSTDGSEKHLEIVREHGAGFVQKPFAPETLRDQILRTTGISYVEQDGERAAQCSGPDF